MTSTVQEPNNKNTASNTTAATDPSNTAAATDPRDTPAFRGVQKQVLAAQQEATELRKQLEKIRADEDKRTKAKLAEEGKLQELLEAERKEKITLAQQVADLKLQTERGKIEMTLVSEGVSNEYTREGIISRYLAAEKRPEFLEHLAELKEKNPEVFGAAKTTNAAEGRTSGSVGSLQQGTTKTGAQLKADIQSGDIKRVGEARKELDNYYRQHGTLPAGFESP